MGTGGLRCAHSRRDVALGQTGRLPCIDHFAGDVDHRAEAVRRGLDHGIRSGAIGRDSRGWL
jgi:hypothetical protein